ncbi:MAG: AraC family transcriptional regulator ligand-binding domain-containing protein [Granulosicoccus sp.]
MGWVSVIFVHKALDAAMHLSCVDATKRVELFKSVGLDPQAPVDPKKMISDSDFFGLLEQILEQSDRARSIPIQIGAAMRCDDYGAFGLAFKSAPDLLGSYQRVECFGKVVTSIANFHVEHTDGSIVMAVIPAGDQRLGLTITNELAVAAAVAISREVNDKHFAPLAVYLRASKPENDEMHRAHFRCPIYFESNRDALEVDKKIASLPNRLSDSGMLKFFEAHLNDELSSIKDNSMLERRILDQIANALSEGVPSVAEVAGQLAMSSRTLQRRLLEEGLAYQDLVAEARKALATQLLKKTDYAIAEIAFLTGFSDQSSFTRAFKRWQGQTPANYRRRE